MCRKRDSSSGTVSQGITTRTERERDGKQSQYPKANKSYTPPPIYLSIEFLDEWVIAQGGVVHRSEFCQSRRSNEKKSGAFSIEGQTNRFCTLLLLFHIIINVKLRSPPSLRIKYYCRGTLTMMMTGQRYR